MEGIIRETGNFLLQTGRLDETQRDAAVEGWLERERVAPTAIGHGCAIPHFYSEAFDEPRMVFVRLKHPLNLGAPDGVATRFIFMLVGPEGSAARHLDMLATIARLMADDEFHYEATDATSQQAVLDALDRHARRSRPSLPPSKAAEKPDEFTPTSRPFEGLKQDLARRLPHYLDDFRQGFQKKCVASILFMFFACLAPAVTFGGLMGAATEGQIGPVEMLIASSIGGMIYALFAGQPLIILGGIGPLYIFTIILFRLCQQQELEFLPVYAWVGLWTGLFTIITAVTNASNLMRYFTRFTDEIFSALMSLIFIDQAVRALVRTFDSSFSDENASHDGAFLTLLLTLGTFYIAMSLSRFRRSHYLMPWMREFLADFGPTIALAAMALVAWFLSEEVSLATLSVSEGVQWPSLIDLGNVPGWVRFAAAGPALLATLLIYLSQNITARLVNSSENKITKGAAYHLDLLVVGLLVAACSLFGFPWLVAATVRSLAHVRALADTEEVSLSSGGSKERIIHMTENRLTGFVIHLLILITALFFLKHLSLVPMAALYGIFLYMGFVSFVGNQFIERLSLWVMDSAMYPATHYIRRVPIKATHLYTLLQFACLVILCVINVYDNEVVRILFPVFIALLVPVRFLANGFFRKEDLAVLDADEEPDAEESHWF